MSTSTPPPPALHLPYTFDTRRHGRAMVTGLIVLDGVLMLAAAGLMIWARHPLTQFWIPLGIWFLALAQIALGLFMFRAAGGAFGTVGRLHVTIEPDRLFGVTARNHRGTFPITEFKAVRLERIGAGGTVGVLRLVGKNPLLQITLAAAPYDTLKPVADFLCTELKLEHMGTSA